MSTSGDLSLESDVEGSLSGFVVGTLLPSEPVHLDHLAAAAHLGERPAPAGLFGILERKPLQFALEPEGLLLGLDGGLQRGGFLGQLPPQLEGDLSQPRVGLGDRSEHLVAFVFARGDLRAGTD